MTPKSGIISGLLDIKILVKNSSRLLGRYYHLNNSFKVYLKPNFIMYMDEIYFWSNTSILTDADMDDGINNYTIYNQVSI
jgi:hypothetical protein